jgi:hypothetical protein
MNTPLTVISYIGGPDDGMEYNMPPGYPPFDQILLRTENPEGFYYREADGKYYWRFKITELPKPVTLPQPQPVISQNPWVSLIPRIALVVGFIIVLLIVFQVSAYLHADRPKAIPYAGLGVPTASWAPGSQNNTDNDHVIPSPSWKPTEPDPWKHWKPVPRAQPVEVRRATRAVLAHMPDGSTQVLTVVGTVTQQEELPLSGNSIGDTYFVAGIPFVWTQLNNGTGAWIDP